MINWPNATANSMHNRTRTKSKKKHQGYFYACRSNFMTAPSIFVECMMRKRYLHTHTHTLSNQCINMTFSICLLQSAYACLFLRCSPLFTRNIYSPRRSRSAATQRRRKGRKKKTTKENTWPTQMCRRRECFLCKPLGIHTPV